MIAEGKEGDTKKSPFRPKTFLMECHLFIPAACWCHVWCAEDSIFLAHKAFICFQFAFFFLYRYVLGRCHGNDHDVDAAISCTKLAVLVWRSCVWQLVGGGFFNILMHASARVAVLYLSSSSFLEVKPYSVSAWMYGQTITINCETTNLLDKP